MGGRRGVGPGAGGIDGQAAVGTGEGGGHKGGGAVDIGDGQRAAGGEHRIGLGQGDGGCGDHSGNISYVDCGGVAAWGAGVAGYCTFEILRTSIALVSTLRNRQG